MDEQSQHFGDEPVVPKREGDVNVRAPTGYVALTLRETKQRMAIRWSEIIVVIAPGNPERDGGIVRLRGAEAGFGCDEPYEEILRRVEAAYEGLKAEDRGY